MGSEDIAASNS